MNRSTGTLRMRPAAAGAEVAPASPPALRDDADAGEAPAEPRPEATIEAKIEAKPERFAPASREGASAGETSAEAKPERFAPASSRSTVRRKAQRASYDPEVVFAILDAGLVAHVAFVHDDHPFVIPMVYTRKDRELMLHGAAASRMLGAGAGGAPLSACVTIIDGLVYGHSAFHHSMNYRSVVVLGRAREVVTEPEKREFLAALVERSSPGRSRLVRPPSAKELAATRVLALPIEEASAKIRVGGPLIDAEDLGVPVWTGQLPLALRAMSHIPTPDDERTEASGGGHPAGLAGGAGGNAPRGIDAPRFARPTRPRGVD
jgi:nitroimidazol reductase NimA-like FMN-containing flavoprotein (pyridoxamine 5'-phosphate oxidase superfamily)